MVAARRRPAALAATMLLSAGGLGYLRPASGTWGSLPPPVAVLAAVTLTGSTHWIDASLLATALAFSIVCVALGPFAERHYGAKDPGTVVADEVAGQAIALLALPWRRPEEAGALAWNAGIALTAFLAFRVFDIIKPPPARGLQVLPAGWGILVDDLLAGVYALVVVQLIARVVLGAAGA